MKLFRVVAVDCWRVVMSFKVLALDLEAAHELGTKCAGQPVRVLELSNMQAIGIDGGDGALINCNALIDIVRKTVLK